MCGRTAGFLCRALGRQRGAFRCSRRAGRGFGRTNRDGGRAGGGRDGHNRHHRHGGYSGFLVVNCDFGKDIKKAGHMQPHVSAKLVQLKNGRAVVTALDVFPGAAGVVGGLQPTVAVPLRLDFAGVVPGRKAELRRAEVVNRAFEQRGVVRATQRRVPEQQAAEK